MNNYILGIDLGTTNSVASVWDGKKYIIITNNKNNLFPSIVDFTLSGKKICDNKNHNPIRNVKRMIGKNELDNNINLYNDIEIIDNIIYFFNKFENKKYTIEEINSLILKKISNSANKQLDTVIKDVVITIPANFNEFQRNSILLSAKIAQLNCVRLINEPTSAALCYGLTLHNDINTLIIDIGGGTSDLSILNIDEGVYDVINTYGDNNLGGEDFTNILIKDTLIKFKNVNKFINLDENIIKKNEQMLRKECERLKCNIETNNNISIDNFYVDNEKNINLNLNVTFTKIEIEKLFSDLCNKIIKLIEDLLLLSDFNKNDIDYIILVGGSTKLKYLQFKISSFFGKEPICNIDPELVVGIGAGIQGYLLLQPDNPFSENITLIDILSLSIGIESDDGIFTKIINKGTKLPVKKHKFFTTDENNQTEINIKIYQGDRKFAKDNFLIGNFKLNNIKIKLKGQVIIKVEVHVDHNGIINVTAYEKGINNKNSIKIKDTLKSFDKKVIDNMINDSEKFNNLDIAKTSLIKIKNKLKSDISNLEYNCYFNKNNYLNDADKEELSKFIDNIKNKYNSIINNFDFLSNNFKNDYECDDINIAIVNIKKLIKLCSKKYTNLVEDYVNNQKIDEYANLEQQNNNENLINILSKKINNIQDNNNISKYTKEIILNNYKNLTYKLQSDYIEENNYKTFLEDFDNDNNLHINNDNNLVYKYGDSQFYNEFIEKNNLNYNKIDSNINKVIIFNKLYDLCKNHELFLD